MQKVDSLKDFEMLLGNSIDVCVVNVDGAPPNNVIRLYSYLDFDKNYLIEVRPQMCYLDEFISNVDAYGTIWEYASEFSSDRSMIYDDPFEQMYMSAANERGFSLTDKYEDTYILMKNNEIDKLKELRSGIYVVGFIDEKVSQSPRND